MRETKMHVLGIDGGGTRTRAVMVDPQGDICGWATAGCGNFQVVGKKGVVALVEQLVMDSGENGSIGALAMCLGLAGAGRIDEQVEIAEAVRAAGLGNEVRVVSDARAALEGAHGGDSGLIVIAGTGSMVLGKNEEDREVRAGGWGPLLGDEGSGYSIGLEGLRAVFRARDGWGEETLLSRILMEELELESWDDAVRKVYGEGMGRDRIAALAPKVFAAARAGDPVADRIVKAAGKALGQLIGAVARRLGMEREIALAGVGGVFNERQMLWPALEEGVGEGAAELRWAPLRLPPVMGAVLLGWRLAGGTAGPEWVESLARNCPQFP